MTLLDEIQLKCTPELLASRDHQAIADAVNVGRTQITSKVGGIGTVMDALGPDAGAALLDHLEAMAPTYSAVKWALLLIRDGTLDFGLDSTRAMIAALVPSPAKEALLALSEAPDTVSAEQIEVAMKDETGAYK